jgi:hypothetical protein
MGSLVSETSANPENTPTTTAGRQIALVDGGYWRPCAANRSILIKRG